MIGNAVKVEIYHSVGIFFVDLHLFAVAVK